MKQFEFGEEVQWHDLAGAWRDGRWCGYGLDGRTQHFRTPQGVVSRIDVPVRQKPRVIKLMMQKMLSTEGHWVCQVNQVSQYPFDKPIGTPFEMEFEAIYD